MNLTKRRIKCRTKESPKAKMSKFMEGDFPYIFRASDSTSHEVERPLMHSTTGITGRIEGKVRRAPDYLDIRRISKATKYIIRLLTHAGD